MIRVSNRWTTLANTPALMTSPSDDAWRARSIVGVKAETFLFGTSRMTYFHTKTGK